MPTPRPGETEAEFMARCIPMLEDEGNDHDQAVAICLTMYQDREEPTMGGEQRQDRRFVPLEAGECRLMELDSGRQLRGLGIVFDQLSEDLGGFRERIAPGAADDAIRSSDVRALFNHDPNLLLGRSTSGTLRLATDAAGVRYEIDLPDTQVGRDLAVSVDRRDLTGNSFSFTVAEDGETWETVDGVLTRTITRFAEIFDVGPVTFPAYRATFVSARSREHAEQIARHLPPDTKPEQYYRRRLVNAATFAGLARERDRP